MASGQSYMPELRERALRRVTQLRRGGSALKAVVDEAAKETGVDVAALRRRVRKEDRAASERQLYEVLCQAGFKKLTQAQPTQSTLQALLDALAAAKAEQPSLFTASASERALCYRVAVHLESSLRRAGERWDVDCEYNRLRSEHDDYERYVAKALQIDGEEATSAVMV